MRTSIVEHGSDIVELESGMHRWDGKGWVEASPKLRILNGKAVAELYYSVEFSANLATRGAVSITLPNGNRLAMHPLGLAYVDGVNSVMIAEVKDCVGELGGEDENELIYRDAFTDFPIDCKFIVRKGSLSQHVRIRAALPPPTDYGLSENAFLEVFTEAIEFPEGTAETRRWSLANGQKTDIVDERVSFGPMEFVVGQAFFATDTELQGELPVSKAWSTIEGRTFLRERLPYGEIKADLSKLPVGAGVVKTKKEIKRLAGGFLPPPRVGRAPVGDIQVASRRVEPAAYVVDYDLVASVDNLTWKVDTTYYVAGAVSVKTNIFEGGTVIKLAPTNNAKLTLTGPVTNYASQYRPITFTARDDHTIGEVIGTNVLSGYYGTKALELDWYTAGTLFNLEHFRFRYAQVGVHFNGGLGNVLSHAQFVNCSNAVEQTSSDVSLRNALIHRANNAFVGNAGSTNRGEHLTLHEVVNHHTSGNPVLFTTNSLLVAVTNAGAYTGLSNQTASAVGAGFQAVGAGQHYLTNNSVWREAGTVNINSNLLSYLARSTTYAPTVRSNEFIGSNTLLTPQAGRDNGAPDLGYHYAPLDYAINALWVSNCVLTVTNGVAIGGFGNTAIILQRDSQLLGKGLATDLIHFSPYDAVQDEPVVWSPETGGGFAMINTFWSNGVAPRVSMRFAAFDGMPGWPMFHLYTDDGSFRGYTNVTIRDCQFSGGELYLLETSAGNYAFTNNVFERVNVQIMDPITLVIQNSNFRGGSGLLWQINSNGLWQFKNSLVDTSSVAWFSDCVRAYNAFYLSPDFYSNQDTNATETVLSSLTYETGRFGRWYQPTNSLLVNAGSANDAATEGFYWYATTTNHAIEANSRIDVGYHSVGLDQSTGQPWDSNADGTPNYIQDVNGDGITQPSELSGLTMWLKADAGVTNETGGVSGWADQSGNNNHGRQTSTTSRPAEVVGALNGKAVLRFDGTNDYFTLPVAITNALPNAEAIIVLKAESAAPAANKGLWRFGTQNDTYPATDGTVSDSFGRSIQRTIGKPSFDITQFHTYGVANNATNHWSARLNGVTYYQLNTSANIAYPNNPMLGSDQSLYFAGDIAEVVLFARILSDPDRDELSAYLNQRYALVSTPATNAGLRAVAVSSNQVSLSWTNGLSTVALRAVVERRTASGSYSSVATVRNASSYLDSGLLPGTTYYYRLRNVNAAGASPYSFEVSTTTSNSTEQIPLGSARLWLKADAGVASSPVRFWEDQSGQLNHALQDTAANQPERVAWSVHGKPAIHFDRTNDHLNLPNFASGFTEGEAILILRAGAEMPSASRGLWHFGVNGGEYPALNGKISDDFGRQDAVMTAFSTPTLDQYHIYSVSSKSGAWTNRWNGQIITGTNNTTFAFPTSLILGSVSAGAGFFDGDIVEVLIFNKILSDGERSTAHYYLRDKYGFFDSDGDGLLDKDEIANGTNPNLTDTNGDGLSDWEDVQVGFSATSDDIDGDGIPNFQEIINGTSPFSADTDGDGVDDLNDKFPLDPTRSSLPSQPGDSTPPTINLQEPTNATLL